MVVAALVIGSAPPAAAVPFADGGFEPPAVPAAPSGDFTQYFEGEFLGTSAWLVGGSGGDIVNTGNIAAHGGVQSYDLSGSATAPGTLSYTFDTIPGALYFAEFWLTGNPHDFDPNMEFPVKEGSVVVAPALPQNLQFDTDGHDGANPGWVPIRYPAAADSGVVATGSSLTIEFLSTGDPNGAGLMIDDVTISLVPSDVAVTKTGPATVQPSTAFDYGIAVTNNGPGPAAGVVVTDTLPAGYEFTSATAGGSHDSGTVTWDLGILQPNTTVDLVVTVQSPADPTDGPTNGVSVASTTPDPALENNIDTHSSTVSATPDPDVSTTTTTTTSTAPVAQGDAGTLPRTGAEVAPATIAGLASVITGVGLVVVARSRRLTRPLLHKRTR